MSTFLLSRIYWWYFYINVMKLTQIKILYFFLLCYQILFNTILLIWESVFSVYTHCSSQSLTSHFLGNYVCFIWLWDNSVKSYWSFPFNSRDILPSCTNIFFTAHCPSFGLSLGKGQDYCVICVFSLFHSAHRLSCRKTENSASPAQELIALDSYLHWKMQGITTH